MRRRIGKVVAWILFGVLSIGGVWFYTENSLLTIVMAFVVGSAGIYVYRYVRVDAPESEGKGYGIYSRPREDMEAKIRQLQTMMNGSDDQWLENNHLAVVGQEGFQESISESLKVQFGIQSNFQVKANQVFMLMPFNKAAFAVYAQCKKTAEARGFVIKKSDDVYIKGDLLRNIVEHIVESEIIIANLDGKNPNVFYELGIAHTLGKKTILITSYAPKEVPFNVQGQYIIFFQLLEELDRKLGKQLDLIQKSE